MWEAGVGCGWVAVEGINIEKLKQMFDSTRKFAKESCYGFILFSVKLFKFRS